MKEIGGYLEFGDIFTNKEYHDKAISLNTATNALIYLIKLKRIEKIYVPYYLCDCLNKAKKYCKIEYYKIKENFEPDFNNVLEKNEFIYIVNYFGMFNNNKIKKLKKMYINIIIDNVQAFFQKPLNGVDTIYSCRKFFGVTDGAYLYTNSILKENILQDKSKDRFKYLLGRLEENANVNFSDYKINEELLLDLDLAYMSKTTKLILNAIQYDVVKKKRTENFKYLNKYLSKTNKLKINNIKGAYMYPYYTEKAEQIRRELIKS